MSSRTRWTDDFLQHNVQHFWIQNINKTYFVPLPRWAGLLLRVWRLEDLVEGAIFLMGKFQSIRGGRAKGKYIPLLLGGQGGVVGVATAAAAAAAVVSRGGSGAAQYV